MKPSDPLPVLARRLVAEGLGTALLLAVVVGSAIMGDRLAGGNAAIALLVNSIASGCGLVVLILMFGGVSGAHLNPVVTLSEAWQRNLPAALALPYVAAQLVGAFAGVAVAHAMFGEPVFASVTNTCDAVSARQKVTGLKIAAAGPSAATSRLPRTGQPWSRAAL